MAYGALVGINLRRRTDGHRPQVQITRRPLPVAAVQKYDPAAERHGIDEDPDALLPVTKRQPLPLDSAFEYVIARQTRIWTTHAERAADDAQDGIHLNLEVPGNVPFLRREIHVAVILRDREYAAC